MKLFFDKLYHKDFVNHMLSAEFLLEESKWEFTPNLNESDVVPIDYHTELNLDDIKLNNNQILLVWYYETPGNRYDSHRCRIDNKRFLNKHDKTLVFHTNELDNSDPRFIPCNKMYNRQKMFCTDYSNKCDGLQWTSGVPKVVFELSEINKQYSTDNKTFLVPNRVFRSSKDTRNLLRLRLKDYMESIHANMYMSDPEMGIFLRPNGLDKIDNVDTTIGGYWYPIDSYYYNTSYIGIHTESVYDNSTIFYPCEKYFDILIKGSFPLVFGSPNTIENLKKLYNFKFPDWIDYSYDKLYNFDERIDAFFESIHKVSKLSTLDLHSLYLKDKETILEHNKNIFYTKPYHSVYDQVLQAKEILNY